MMLKTACLLTSRTMFPNAVPSISRSLKFKLELITDDSPERIALVVVPCMMVVQRFGVGLVIERSLVRLPAGALSSQLGQLSLPSLLVR